MGGNRIHLVRRGAAGVASVVLLAACAGDSESTTADSAQPTATAASADDDPFLPGEVSTTVASESRPVPTVPPPTIAGQSGATLPGVVNASPTIVPEPPPPADPGSPATTQPPPTTELVGDPQPNPNTTLPPPPPTVEAPDPTCDLLVPFDVSGIVAEAGGSATTTEPVSVSVCRFTSGSIVAEVHFVEESMVIEDWYTRSGIEPVGEVSGDAVGFGSFDPPGGSTTEGYTIALVGGRQGVIVAVRGTGDARFVAGQVAIFANQAA